MVSLCQACTVYVRTRMRVENHAPSGELPN